MSPQSALARPPFDVDDKDVQYAQRTPQPRAMNRQDRNKASESTYDAYDTYLKPDADHHHAGSRDRDSAHGAIGGGLLSALDDSDDSEDDSEETQVIARTATRVTPASEEVSKSKNQALYEAATRGGGGRPDDDDDAPNPSPTPAPPAYGDVGRPQGAKRLDGGVPLANSSNRGTPSPNGVASPPPNAETPPCAHRPSPPNLHPEHHNNNVGTTRLPSPAPSITPPPAAPLQVHIQMNAPQPQRPIPHATHGPPPRMPMPRGPPHALTVDTSRRPLQPKLGPGGPSPRSNIPYGMPVGFHMTPTEIPNDTASPIVPAFIKPIKPGFIQVEDGEKSASVVSHESTMPIMRGEKEDYLPVRSTGPGVGRRAPRVGQMNKDGDDFWRRFSMVAKREKTLSPKDKRSTWLKSAQGHSNALNRWTWCVGIFMLIAIAGGSVAGWWFTRSNPAHAIPVAIGGGASETMGPSTTIPTPIGAGPTSTGKAGATTTQKARAAATTRPGGGRAKRSQEDLVGGPAATPVRRGKRHGDLVVGRAQG